MDTLQNVADHGHTTKCSGSRTHYKVQWITDHGHTTKCSGSWTHYKVQWITDHGHTTKCSGSRIMDTLQSVGITDHGHTTNWSGSRIMDTLQSGVDHGHTTQCSGSWNHYSRQACTRNVYERRESAREPRITPYESDQSINDRSSVLHALSPIPYPGH